MHNAYGSAAENCLHFVNFFFSLSCNFESCSVVFAFRCFGFCLFFIKDGGYVALFIKLKRQILIQILNLSIVRTKHAPNLRTTWHAGSFDTLNHAVHNNIINSSQAARI